MSTRIQNRLNWIFEILDGIAFHPDVSWKVDQYMGGSEEFGTSRHVMVQFSWEIPDPRNQPTGREGYHCTEILTEDEINGFDDEGLRRRLLYVHEKLWRHVCQEWSQNKPGRHLRSVS